MKKLSKEDLSLDKQEVSSLGKSTETKGNTLTCFYETLDNNCTKSEDFNCKTNEDACNLTVNSNTCRCTINDCNTQRCDYTKTVYQICCDNTVKGCPSIDPKCPTLDYCPESNDETTCAISDVPGCMTPIPETQHC